MWAFGKYRSLANIDLWQMWAFGKCGPLAKSLNSKSQINTLTSIITIAKITNENFR